MLLEEFLKQLGITQSAFANAERGVTPDTALRLARVTGMSADFWLGLRQDWLRAQAAYDTQVAKRGLSDALQKIRPWRNSHNRLGRTA